MEVTKGQIFAIIGFLIILISIPLSFVLVKNTQIFKSKADEIKTKPTPTPNKTAKNVPNTSPLQDLQTLLDSTASSSLSNTPAPTVTSSSIATSPTPTSAPISGPSLSGKVTFEGRSTTAEDGHLFIGIAAGQPVTRPTYVLTLSLNTSTAGSFNNISLAGFTLGSVYTAYLKGDSQLVTASTFTLVNSENSLNNGQPVSLLSGDLNDDNTVNSADYTIVSKLIGTTPSSTNWNPQADINGDKVVNTFDLGYISKNMGKIGDSGVWYSPIPQASSSASLTTPSNIGGSNDGGYWIWFPPVK